MGLGEVVRHGWHPEKNSGRKESWRSDFKGVNQVAGLIGKGKEDKSHSEDAHNHVSRPLTSLQDPSSFGAPPKHRDYYGEEAAAASIPTQASSSATSQAEAPAVPKRFTQRVDSPAVPQQEGAAEKRRSESPEKPPPGPFRIDTTGLSTANLPPPPVHRDKRVVEPASYKSSPSPIRSHTTAPPTPATVPLRNADLASSSPSTKSIPPPVPSRSAVAQAASTPAKPKPTLPPRSAVAGETRSHSGSDRSPPPPYSASADPPYPPAAAAAAAAAATPAMGELQARFARIQAREAEQQQQEDQIVQTNAGADQAGTAAEPPPIPLSTKPR